MPVAVAMALTLVAAPARSLELWLHLDDHGLALVAIDVGSIRVRGPVRRFWYRGRPHEVSVDLERRVHAVVDCDAETFRIDGGVTYRRDGRHVHMPESINSPAVALVPGTQIAVLGDLVCDSKWVKYTEQALGLYAALSLVPPPSNAKEIRELLTRDGFELVPSAPDSRLIK